MNTDGRKTALRITEIFHSIQGESTAAGLPCVFVRLTGCPLRCRWCDTAYAFEGGTLMTQDEVMAQVASFGCTLVEVTGGEPMAQPGCVPLLRRLADSGYRPMLETSGALSVAEVDSRVRVVMDLKCPDSGEVDRTLWQNLPVLKPDDEIKFVIASRRDYEWARAVLRDRQLVSRHAILFAPVWGELEPARLAEWILADRLPVRLQIQVHKVLYGAEAQGV